MAPLCPETAYNPGLTSPFSVSFYTPSLPCVLSLPCPDSIQFPLAKESALFSLKYDDCVNPGGGEALIELRPRHI